MAEQTHRKRALLLTSKTGGGHNSLADALRDRLGTAFDCTINDPQLFVVHAYYRLVSRYALWLYEAEYRFIDQPQRVRAAQQVFAGLLEIPMRRAISHARPDLVISLFPYYTLAMQNAIRAEGSHAAATILLADPQDVHAGWLVIKDVDAILAPTRETHAQVQREGFTPDQVHLVGWPVRNQFLIQAGLLPHPAGQDGTGLAEPGPKRDAALRALGLQPGRFTVFLQGGGEGAAYIDKTVEAILKVGAQDPRFAVQIILATGTNQRLRMQFEGTPGLHALPFTREIARYMALGDVVMGKAGPNTLFEAMTLGKPFIATTFIPGQESPNLDFIRRHRLGWVALKTPEMAALLYKLTHEPERMAEQVAAVEAYRRWNQEQQATLLPNMLRLVERLSRPIPAPSRRAPLART